MHLTGIGAHKFGSLDDIFFDEDSAAVFVGVKAKQEKLSVDDKLLGKLKAIEAFYEEHQRLPSVMGADLKEKSLYRSLQALKSDTAHLEALKTHDGYGLLADEVPAFMQPLHELDAELEPDPDFGLIGQEANAHEELPPAFTSLDDILSFADGDDIFADLGDLSVVQDVLVDESKGKGVRYPDEFMGSRFACEDFWRFEPHFDRIKKALKDGTATFNPLQTEQNLFVGDIFLLNGIVCFIAEKMVEERKSDRKNYRLRLIFENGLESNMLMRSLARAIYKDQNGRQILLNDDNALGQMFSQNLDVLPSGYIYIAQMEQLKPELAQFKNLYKIGFTRNSVTTRLDGCEDDIAFLESKVRVVASIECKNMDPHVFERMIHTFFAVQRLNMMLKAKDGKMYKPQEWFNVELETILEVAQRIIDKSIIHFRMDNTTGRVVLKKQ